MSTMKLKPFSTPRFDAQTVLDIRKSERERRARLGAGLLRGRHEPAPYTLRILILVDGGISFSPQDFGLSAVLDTLRETPEWWANIEVTRAHRQQDPSSLEEGTPAFQLDGPHYEDFSFDKPPAGFRLEDYHQVWIFGIASGDKDALSKEEVEILSTWMEKGGGVLAMGDHDTLGEALASRIPRVKSMRKWTKDEQPPSVDGKTRHDTLRKGRSFKNEKKNRDEGLFYTFDDESDDVPMNLRLRQYPQPTAPGVSAPHPLLCASDGSPIDVFPDHPHEGEVREPAKLEEGEYPRVDGVQIAPEIIAWAQVQGDHGENDFKGKVNAKEFGAVGAYDGHPAGVGRVVVDSTWHHWFDVNLIGRSEEKINDDSGDRRKLNGFEGTPEGQRILKRIQNYYRNVAIWLAPPAAQRAMLQRLLWGALNRYPLAEELRPGLPVEDIGRLALAVLPQFAGRAATASWSTTLSPEWARLVQKGAQERTAFTTDLLRRGEVLMLGAVLRKMLEARRSSFNGDTLPDDAQLEELVASGSKEGLRLLDAMVKERGEAAQRVAQALTTGFKQLL